MYSVAWKVHEEKRHRIALGRGQMIYFDLIKKHRVKGARRGVMVDTTLAGKALSIAAGSINPSSSRPGHLMREIRPRRKRKSRPITPENGRLKTKEGYGKE